MSQKFLSQFIYEKDDTNPYGVEFKYQRLAEYLAHRFAGMNDKKSRFSGCDLYTAMQKAFGSRSSKKDFHSARVIDSMTALLRNRGGGDPIIIKRDIGKGGGPINVTSDVKAVLNSSLKAAVNLSLNEMRKNSAHEVFTTYSPCEDMKEKEYPTLFVNTSKDEGYGEMHKLAETAAVPMLVLEDYTQTIPALQRYGSSYVVSRQAFHNDEQGAIMAMHMNAAGAMSVESKLVMDAVSNGTIDGKSIYQADQGTLLQNAALSADTVGKMMANLASLKLGGSYIPLTLKYLLVPPAKKAAAMMVVSEMFGKYDDYEGDIKVLSDPRLKGDAFYGIPLEAGDKTPFVVVSFYRGAAVSNDLGQLRPGAKLETHPKSKNNDSVAFTSNIYLGVAVTNPICVKADGVE